MKRFTAMMMIVGAARITSPLASAARSRDSSPPSNAAPVAARFQDTVGTRDLRLIGVHDAGDLYLPISAGLISDGFNYSASDPETNNPTRPVTFPTGSRRGYVFGSALWVGGIVDGDTLVSVAMDGWLNIRQFFTEDPRGGTRRIGDYADDEFVSTAVDSFAPVNYPPLGVALTAHSSSWADTLYDNFVLITYTVRNLRDRPLAGVWAGLYMDNDIYHQVNQTIGYNDDCSGVLDTLLFDDDPASRTLIGYSYDNDGDPGESAWDSTSVVDAISVRLVEASVPIATRNFNWWINNYVDYSDFGPHHLGTPEDPLRFFADSNLGYPVTEGDKYYLLAHPEIDYDQIETAVHDSSEGWLPPSTESALDLANGYDTRFVYSFGPFDLAAGDSVSFTLAIVAADRLHREPNDFATWFDPLQPDVFRDRLDIGSLMRQHRRADSVWKSGLTLPNPGPPQGLTVADYGESSVRLTWWPCRRPDLAGYYLYVQGSMGQWLRTSPYMLTDTTGLFYPPDPSMVYHLAVGAVDSLGRTSGVSVPVTVLPGRPQPVDSLKLHMDGMTPEISWIPHDNAAPQAFIIYRCVWKEPYIAYDSTAAWSYRDLRVESGVQYNYRVTTKNRLGLESYPAGPVNAILLARDRGTLFYSLNRPGQPNSGPFQNQYLDELYQSAADVAPIAWYNQAEGTMGLKQMADYSLIVLDWEKREDGLPLGIVDSLRYYLSNGGTAVFILLSTESITSTRKVYRYAAGSFFHDILKLDSAVTNGYNLQDGAFHGDLTGCQPVTPEYPVLLADTLKFRTSMIPVHGFIPMAGYLFPTAEAEPLYRYVSACPDSISHGQCNGIRYDGDDYRFLLFTFPLSLMKSVGARRALRQALTDMGVDMGCGDICVDDAVTVGDAVTLINYLYRGGPPPAVPAHADVDGSGAVDVGDAVYLVNFLFQDGPRLICPQSR